ncbi:MAG: Hint domain-containing protein [Pseudomonadota bacterium]
MRGKFGQFHLFTPGTLIATDRGWRPVEELCRGDRVVTRDNGLLRVVWTGRRDLNYSDLGQVPQLRPMLIRKGAFGPHTPTRDMLVSPYHRFPVLPDADATAEAYYAAWHMRQGRGIDAVPVLGVSYLHLLLNAQQAILADGAWTECFHPDDLVQSALGARTRVELLALFPEIATQGAARQAASPPANVQSRFER